MGFLASPANHRIKTECRRHWRTSLTPKNLNQANTPSKILKRAISVVPYKNPKITAINLYSLKIPKIIITNNYNNKRSHNNNQKTRKMTSISANNKQKRINKALKNGPLGLTGAFRKVSPAVLDLDTDSIPPYLMVPKPRYHYFSISRPTDKRDLSRGLTKKQRKSTKNYASVFQGSFKCVSNPTITALSLKTARTVVSSVEEVSSCSSVKKGEVVPNKAPGRKKSRSCLAERPKKGRPARRGVRLEIWKEIDKVFEQRRAKAAKLKETAAQAQTGGFLELGMLRKRNLELSTESGFSQKAFCSVVKKLKTKMYSEGIGL